MLISSFLLHQYSSLTLLCVYVRADRLEEMANRDDEDEEDDEVRGPGRDVAGMQA